jgi:hypothetical protein
LRNDYDSVSGTCRFNATSLSKPNNWIVVTSENIVFLRVTLQRWDKEKFDSPEFNVSIVKANLTSNFPRWYSYKNESNKDNIILSLRARAYFFGYEKKSF